MINGTNQSTSLDYYSRAATSASNWRQMVRLRRTVVLLVAAMSLFVAGCSGTAKQAVRVTATTTRTTGRPQSAGARSLQQQCSLATTSTTPTSSEPSAPVPYDAWGLGTALEASSPSTFGGLYYADDGSLVILATCADAVDAMLAHVATFSHTQTAPSPIITSRIVANSFHRLSGLQDVVVAADNTFARAGVTINLVGIDVEKNALKVGIANDTGASEALVLRTVHASKAEVEFVQVSAMTRLAARPQSRQQHRHPA